jgi:hypothetical protein
MSRAWKRPFHAAFADLGKKVPVIVKSHTPGAPVTAEIWVTMETVSLPM